MGVALGTCGPSLSENFAYLGTAIVDVFQGGQLVKSVSVGLGEGFRFRVAPGSYQIKYHPDPKFPKLSGPAVHVKVVSASTAQATIVPQCSDSS
jgi:hypothetical protein